MSTEDVSMEIKCTVFQTQTVSQHSSGAIPELILCKIYTYRLVGQGRYSAHKFSLVKILMTPSYRPPPVNSDITIVFPAPDLVCRDPLSVGVPYFFAELWRTTTPPYHFPKKTQ
jgi:hypothetical protein